MAAVSDEVVEMMFEEQRTLELYESVVMNWYSPGIVETIHSEVGAAVSYRP